MSRNKVITASGKIDAILMISSQGIVNIINGRVLEFYDDGCLLELGSEVGNGEEIELRILDLDVAVFKEFSNMDADFNPHIDFEVKAVVVTCKPIPTSSLLAVKVRYKGSYRIANAS